MKRKWILWLIIPITFLILVAAADHFILEPNRFTLEMTMAGDAIIPVALGEEFTDPGATAVGDDLIFGTEDVPVTCAGQVDTNTLGVYRLEYTSQYHDQLCTSYRDVHVIESHNPTITLVSDPDTYTLPGQAYVEEGFTATDWYDGDLTQQVESIEKDGVVTYTVTNSAGYTGSAQRPIHYDDPVAPQLQLTEGEAITIDGGKPFRDPGFTATDNVDGDLTQQVQVTGMVDVYLPDTYTLTYTVQDSWGNVTTAQRQVTVELNLPKPSGDKIVYLTFDDGPGAYTGKLLDILAKYNVKASFFVVNTGNIALVERMAAEGHTVAIHSATHNYSKIYSSDEAFYEDLYYMQSIIASYTGQTPYLFRFPGGSSNAISREYNKGIMSRLVKSTRENGFRYFDWNVDSKDAGGASTSEEVFQNVIKGLQENRTSVVLQHDIKDFSVAAVEKIIVWGLANGYTFLPLTANSPSFAHGVNN